MRCVVGCYRLGKVTRAVELPGRGAASAGQGTRCWSMWLVLKGCKGCAAAAAPVYVSCVRSAVPVSEPGGARLSARCRPVPRVLVYGWAELGWVSRVWCRAGGWVLGAV
ncbi:hypothetical protein GCM10010321_00010 [Streptomyces chartreusis]|nr:hypothetical protein GCM10010321_00010 [Streptomyces chartreusis]